MLETELAYFAGYVDGEGCISVIKQQTPSREYYYRLMVSVASKNPASIQRFADAFGGKVYQSPDCCRWIISSYRALRFLTKILPYLHLKRLEALLAIQFQSNKEDIRLAASREGEILFREMHSQLLRHIKHRKVDDVSPETSRDNGGDTDHG